MANEFAAELFSTWAFRCSILFLSVFVIHHPKQDQNIGINNSPSKALDK